MPTLVGVLGEYDQRTTLKEEALKALGALGDPAAVEPIGRLLDRSLDQTGAELRLAALPVLGQLGGTPAASSSAAVKLATTIGCVNSPTRMMMTRTTRSP